jgi:hypothetical protein
MKEQKVGRWLKKGYPHFKEESGLPAHVMPEHSFSRMTDELGDESIIELSQPLQLAEGIQDSIEKEPDPETVPTEVWKAAITLWPACPGVRPVVESCLDAIGRIMSQLRSGRLEMSVEVVCRAVVVLGFAPFIAAGREIMEDIATVLGGNADEPPGMIKRYTDAVTSGDIETVSNIDCCIAEHARWQGWVERLLQQVRDFPYTPKPVGITPPLSAEVIGALARMLKEEENNEP